MLNSVEFLTGVWHYSAVVAGLAIAPGPLMVLPFARIVAPRAAAWLGGPGRIAVVGCAVNAGGQLLWYTQIQAQPAYLTHLLPAQLLGGAGVGLTIPSLLAAGSASLTPARFGAGSGILNTARQVGTVLGVAGLIAILAHVSHADPVAGYRDGLVLIIAFFAAAAAAAAALLTSRPAPAFPERQAVRSVVPAHCAEGAGEAELWAEWTSMGWGSSTRSWGRAARSCCCTAFPTPAGSGGIRYRRWRMPGSGWSSRTCAVTAGRTSRSRLTPTRFRCWPGTSWRSLPIWG